MQNQYKKFSALIIDDEEDICMLLKMILKKHNMDVHVALNLAEGIRTTALVKPSVIFLDNNLPDGLGIENIEKIKAISKSSKVMMISAMSNLQEKAIANGAFMFIDKPLTSLKIKEALDTLWTFAKQSDCHLPNYNLVNICFFVGISYKPWNHLKIYQNR